MTPRHETSTEPSGVMWWRMPVKSSESLARGGGLAEGSRPVVLEVGAGRDGERGEAGVVDVVVYDKAVAPRRGGR